MILHTYNSFSSNNSANARSGNFVILLLAKSLKKKTKNALAGISECHSHFTSRLEAILFQLVIVMITQSTKSPGIFKLIHQH